MEDGVVVAVAVAAAGGAHLVDARSRGETQITTNITPAPAALGVAHESLLIAPAALAAIAVAFVVAAFAALPQPTNECIF